MNKCQDPCDHLDLQLQGKNLKGSIVTLGHDLMYTGATAPTLACAVGQRSTGEPCQGLSV